MATKSNDTPVKKEEKVSYYEAVGRRRVASARVRLYVVADAPVTVNGVSVERGAMFVNNRSVEKYFPGEIFKKLYLEPFRTTNTVGRFAVTITVKGGGLHGQLEATIHGISRALEKVDKEKFRPILKKRGFMKRDPRAKQRRKAGYAGKSRARKQSPKR
ncbi:30S ribosomal protein S9 [Candidatus Gottesmanbacteria bacterium RIFCSPHIGHO2_01_FULL_46_14]|uniref:30S ribosomal protein S9 n=1 Tax=Candidatus Gottesmanbacteria bacterium RIFCSPHIGHO2_01_FULL_46_14 TaxID=1798380 RepID=A0A1F5ZLA6_9BACT|nr:MAG: 30S ribosomal protein S9 [Candidatus Gottesmanbacteria bacterium RIFCSPHIGHO2_01_FULL_46_14]